MTRAVSALAAVCLAACSSGPGSGDSEPEAAGAALAAPQESFDAGGARPTKVFFPPGLDKSTPAPLLVMLHGYTSDSATEDAYLGLGEVAAAKGIIYTRPDALEDHLGKRFWNSEICCNVFRVKQDDVGYLTELISEIKGKANIDASRVYVFGHSNGGFMAYQLACERPDLVTGIVSIGSATYDDPNRCKPSKPVSVLEVHATEDGFVKYEGGRTPVIFKKYAGAERTREIWANYNHCQTGPTRLDLHRNVDVGIDFEGGPFETTVDVHQGCDGGTQVELWTIPGGEHIPKLAPTATGEMVDFLLAHPRLP